MKSDLLDLEVILHARTKMAVKVSTDGNSTKAVWVPREHIEIEHKYTNVYALTLPEWLAFEKGLI